MPSKQKTIVTAGISAIVILVLLSLIPLFISLNSGPGLKAEPLNAENAKPATTDLDGTWVVSRGHRPNTSAVGFTFFEILPGDKRLTSGATEHVTGHIQVSGDILQEGTVTVDMDKIATDNERRDINVRNKVFDTDTYPTAYFELTSPVALTNIPDNGYPAEVEIAGDLTIKGTTVPVKAMFQVLRDAEWLIFSGDIPISRTAFKVETPDFIAASIADEGDVNIRLSLRKNEEKN
ncbi:YceI family protein [Corynebacterium caspium]|uniref:YceI family protein n=1 Tax=Corynebacterium caspium TaxID=234828 RepID=UPI0003601775|nr:YceI family protein [Corynebacterium caspium]WKD59316.1 YceI-like domain protein [Corynebacterium caspium DSM 44850]